MLLAIAGCVATLDRESELIRAAVVELGHTPVIVLPESLPQRTRRAVQSVTRTVSERDVPASTQWRLPPDYFVLQDLELSRNEGTISGLLGPVPAPRPGVGLLACGSHIVMRFKRENGVWHLQERQDTVC